MYIDNQKTLEYGDDFYTQVMTLISLMHMRHCNCAM